MKTILALLLISSLGFTQQIPDTTKQQGNFNNLIDNAGFENGSALWTNTGGTFAVSSASPLLGKNSLNFTASAGSQFFSNTAKLVPIGLRGQDCMVSSLYSGGSANLYLTVVDGTGTEILPTTARAILNTSSGNKTAKIYFTCPSSGSVAARVVSTAASAIAQFDNFYIGNSDSIPVSAITSDVNYTPVFTGFGVPANVDVKYSRVGKKLKIIARFALGTTSATGASVSLPNGWTVSSKYTSSKVFGFGNRLVPTAATKNYTIIASPNDTTLKFGAAGDTQTPNPISPLNGTDIGSSGQDLTFSAELEINQFPESELVVNSKCPNDITCENTFSAKVSNAGVVSDENLDWLSGNCSGTPPYVCNFNASIFSVTPNCSVTLGSTGGTETRINAQSTSSITIGTFNSAGGTSSTDFTLICRKTGADFKARQNIQAFLTSTITSGANSERIERAEFAYCTSSPCTIIRQSGSVSSITRSSTGRYTINILAGTFSQIPTVLYTSRNTAIGRVYPEGSCTSTTSCSLSFDIYTGAATDADASILLIGPR